MRVRVRMAELIRRMRVGVGTRMDLQPPLRRITSMYNIRRKAVLQEALTEHDALAEEAAAGRVSRMSLSRVGEWSYV